MIQLSPTHKKLLSLCSQGLSSREMAELVNLKDGTVRIYLYQLYRRIGVRNKTEAAVWWLENQRKHVVAAERL